jgi:hypothetical protein
LTWALSFAQRHTYTVISHPLYRRPLKGPIPAFQSFHAFNTIFIALVFHAMTTIAAPQPTPPHSSSSSSEEEVQASTNHQVQVQPNDKRAANGFLTPEVASYFIGMPFESYDIGDSLSIIIGCISGGMRRCCIAHSGQPSGAAENHPVRFRSFAYHCRYGVVTHVNCSLFYFMFAFTFLVVFVFCDCGYHRQVQPRTSEGQYKGVWRSLVRMWKEEGFRGFMRGNGINCLRIVPYRLSASRRLYSALVYVTHL